MLVTAGFALVAHIGWSAVVVGTMSHFYSHRVFDLTKTKNPARDREEMSAAFFHAMMASSQKQKKPLALFVGSSFTYGYPWQERVIFSKVVADRLSRWRVANLSLIGASSEGILDFTVCALGGQAKPDVLIAEIPLVNSIAYLNPDKKVSMRQCSSTAPPTAYWMPVLTRPYGLGWFTLLWDEEAYQKPDSELQVTTLPRDYFAPTEKFVRIQPLFAQELRSYVEALSSAADRVIFFVSPIYTDGIDEAGGDGESVKLQIQYAYAVCRENPRVSCVDPTSLVLGREMFYNLTHLNQRGHRALGEYFARELMAH